MNDLFKQGLILSCVILGVCLLQVHADANLERLYEHSEKVIKFLKLHYRNVEARVIQNDENSLKRLEATIEAIPDDLISHKLKATLSHQLQMAIIRLASEVNKVTVRSIREASRDDVITKAHIIIQQAQEAVEYLERQHRVQEANTIGNEINQLEKLVSNLQVAKAGTTVYMLEQQIKVIETRLTSDLQRVHHDHPDTNSVDNAHDHDSVYLLHKGFELVKQTEAAIKFLKSHNRTQEASLIEKEETALKRLIDELENAPSATHQMNQLVEIEHRITKGLESVHQTQLEEAIYYDEVHGTHQKEVLLYRANSLIKQTNNAIQQLKAQNRASETNLLEQDELLVKRFVAELESAHPSANLAHLEEELRSAEVRLLNELKRLNIHSLIRRDLKKDLITRGSQLLREATESIQRLSRVHNSHDGNILKWEEEQIKKFVKELESTSDSSLIRKLEHDLRLSELKMTYQLSKINHPHKEQLSAEEHLKQILLQRANTLEKMADEAIKDLQLTDKILESNELENDISLVKNLVQQIINMQNGSGLLHLEQELTQAENQLSAKISKALKVPRNVIRREDGLIKIGHNLL